MVAAFFLRRGETQNGIAANGPLMRPVALALLVALAGSDHRERELPEDPEAPRAWEQIATVLQHPLLPQLPPARQPSAGRRRPPPHIPQVVGGPDNLGVAAIRWANCHNQTGNDPASEKHVREDKLVRWDWQPSPGRETTTNEGMSGPEADAVVGAASSRPQRRRHLCYTMPSRLLSRSGAAHAVESIEHTDMPPRICNAGLNLPIDCRSSRPALPTHACAILFRNGVCPSFSPRRELSSKEVEVHEDCQPSRAPIL